MRIIAARLQVALHFVAYSHCNPKQCDAVAKMVAATATVNFEKGANQTVVRLIRPTKAAVQKLARRVAWRWSYQSTRQKLIWGLGLPAILLLYVAFLSLLEPGGGRIGEAYLNFTLRRGEIPSAWAQHLDAQFDHALSPQGHRGDPWFQLDTAGKPTEATKALRRKFDSDAKAWILAGWSDADWLTGCRDWLRVWAFSRFPLPLTSETDWGCYRRFEDSLDQWLGQSYSPLRLARARWLQQAAAFAPQSVPYQYEEDQPRTGSEALLLVWLIAGLLLVIVARSAVGRLLGEIAPPRNYQCGACGRVLSVLWDKSHKTWDCRECGARWDGRVMRDPNSGEVLPNHPQGEFSA